MGSANSSIAKMIVQYEWILEDVEKEPMTIASKMILFRGEKVFRFGLKNHVESPVLIFIAIGLNKMGMKTGGVTYGIQDSGIGPETLTQMKEDRISDGSLQIFNVNLKKQVTGNCTIVFRICIEGSVPGFSYHLSDRLAKDQLWVAVKSKNWIDVEFVVKGKTISAHKAILAARSPVFANEFAKKQQLRDGLQQIQIDGADLSTVEQLLYFIYTGEPMGTLANEELLKLANDYQVTTLTYLCRNALENIKPMQMASLANNLNMTTEITPTKIRPDKETEIFFDRTTPTFRCVFSFYNLSNNRAPISVMQYQNEDIFFADLAGTIIFEIENRFSERYYVRQPVIHLLCHKLSSFGLKVEDIYFSIPEGNWYQMQLKNLQKNVELQRFTTQPSPTLRYLNLNTVVSIDIKIVSTIGNYYYEMMDDPWMNSFWTAATKQKFTDVEIFVGAVKVMEAHRVILSARSPVLSEAFNKINNTGKSVVTFRAEFDVDTVKHFLNFLYTGSLETLTSKSNKNYQQLLKLATLYEVETLKKICQLADRVPNVEELTNSLLGL